jgi:hypothetical protein
MLCYKGQSFCSAGPGCATTDCGRKITDEVMADATEWWRGFSSKPDDGPLFSMMDFSSRCPDYQPIKET